MTWHPGIGDPTPLGWFTVAAYGATSVLCFAAARSNGTSRSESAYWMAIAALFLFLCANKQLDLQTLFTQVARQWAKADGWYDNRQSYQRTFVAGISAFAAVAFLVTAYLVRGLSKSLRLALLGVSLTCAFVVIRAASFHHVDLWLGRTALGIRWNGLMELGGISIVAASAIGLILSARLAAQSKGEPL